MPFNPVVLPTRQFPPGITTVGIELEGFWTRELDADDIEAEEPEDCPWSLCEWDGGPEDDESDPDNWTRCWRCEDVINGNNAPSSCDERDHQNLKEDGSVHCPPELQQTHVDGEATSPVLRSWAAVEEFVNASYPDAVNCYCGMHVHIGCTRDQWGFSFDQNYWTHLNQTLLNIGATCSQQTQDWLAYRIKHGRSADEADYYCVPNKEEHGIRHSDRYSAVNYRAFGAHGTLEIRVCPMAQGHYHRGVRKDLPPEAQALSLISGVLLATSDYWTQPLHWKKREHAVTIAEDLTLPTVTPDPPDEHAIFTI